MEVWFNPSCSKSRHAAAALTAAGVAYVERRYLDDPPSTAELERLLTALGLQPWDLARLGEPVAAELGLADLPHERARWLEVLLAHPVLIQRPILLGSDGTAWIGRDAESLAAAIAHERPGA